MPFGIDEQYVAAPPDVRGAGVMEYERMIGVPATHPLVGGSNWGSDGSGMQPDAGLSRLVTGGAPSAMGPAGADLRAGLDDWRGVFDWQHSPTPWILLAVLISVGFIHLRVNTKVGPANAKLHLG